jgi:spore coat protein U-like protein
MRVTKPRLLVVALALAAGMAASSVALAGTATGSFQVNATVISSCTVSGALLNFGSSIDPLAAASPLDATSSLTVQCTNTTPYSVSLNAGLNAGSATAFSNRRMVSGAHTLGYQLYTDNGRSTVWGDGTSSSSTNSGTGTGSSQTLTIYGRVPSLSGVVPGTYADTVTVTISY